MDEFTISIPRERPFATVVGLVVGGIAARHEVTLDVLDDLQLALDGVLERTDDDHEGQLTIELRVEGGTIAAFIGPVTDRLRPSWRRRRANRSACAACSRRSSTASRISERDGGPWIELRKGYELAGSEST